MNTKKANNLNTGEVDVVSIATDWARAEAITSLFFVAFGLLFIAAGIGFWRLGKTKMARTYIIPSLIAGILLIVLGGALFGVTSKMWGER